jgi:hypothetical protein
VGDFREAVGLGAVEVGVGVLVGPREGEIVGVGLGLVRLLGLPDGDAIGDGAGDEVGLGVGVAKISVHCQSRAGLPPI